MQLPEDIEKNEQLSKNVKTEEQNENIKYIVLPFMITVVLGLGIILGYQWYKQHKTLNINTQAIQQPTPVYSFTMLPTMPKTSPTTTKGKTETIATPEEIVIDNTEINKYLADLENELQNL